MTDYFQALVERARGEGRTVRPRVPPRFAAELPPTIEVEVDAAAPARPRERDLPAGLGARVPRERSEGRAPVSAPPRPLPRSDPAGEPKQPLPVADVPAKPAVVREPPPPPMPVPAPQLETVHVEREVVEPETVRVPSPPTAVEVVVARPAPEPRREAAALTRQDARARPATSVQAPPAAHSEPAGAPDPAQERTMVVSIGRIEVNAQRPSPPPVRPTTRAWGGPRLSLDDYLRERNGGRR